MRNEKLSFKIKPLKSGDYEQAVICIREARGSAYYSEKFYDAEYLQKEEHELYAAFDDSGVMAGVTGISAAPFENEKSMLSLLNIRPSYTGHGIGSALLSYTTGILQYRGVKAVKGQVVTKYASIQRVLEGLGLRPAGMLHGIRDGQNVTPPVIEKFGLAVYVRNFKVKSIEKMYVHNDIVNIAEKVYTDIGVSLSLQNSGKNGSVNDIRKFYDSHDNVLYSQINECSYELAENLDSLAGKYQAPGGLTQLVFLNLCSPTAFCGYESLKRGNYIFCGFNPLGENESAVFFKGDFKFASSEMTERLHSLVTDINKVGIS